MRFGVARPHERHVPGYSSPGTRAHAVEVAPSGVLAERTMCGLEVAALRMVRAGSGRPYDWLDLPHGHCRRCGRAIERRAVSGDELEPL